MESNKPEIEARLGPFLQVYLTFLLHRVIHDLSNSVSGIVSLSEYHLRTGVDDAVAGESFGLIHESAEASRELLVSVGNLLQPDEEQEEVIRVKQLLEETARLLRMLLPRSVTFQTAEQLSEEQLISVQRADFVRRILALAAMDVSDMRVPSGLIQLAVETDATKAKISYRSMVQSDSWLRAQTADLFSGISRSAEIRSSNEGSRFTLAVTFPLVEL